MKINGSFPIAGLEQYKALRSKTNVVSLPETSKQDQITFSSDAKLFSEAMKAAKSSLSERLEKANIDVDAIKEKIESGAYEVNKEELANSILLLQGYYERR